MQILLKFDDELLTRYDKRGSPIICGITWMQDGIFYPGEGWTDFGAVILGWWLHVVNRLLEGADEDKFSFMDGPYAIRVKYDRSEGMVELRPEKLQVVWKIPFSQLVEELISAANRVCKELERTGTGKDAQVSLRGEGIS